MFRVQPLNVLGKIGYLSYFYFERLVKAVITRSFRKVIKLLAGFS